MKWSPQQEKAMKKVWDWMMDDGGPQVFRLFGYAGTGKTTLAKELVKGTNHRVLFAAYTGKAAQVLTTKGCPATTIHKLIYTPKNKSKAHLASLQEQLLDANQEDPKNPVVIAELEAEIAEEEENLKRAIFQLNLESSPLLQCDLLVIDECSMVDESVGRDILHFGCKVLVLGDPAQLPPVKGGGFFTNSRADFMLTEIHRQAAESPIIHLATKTRNGEILLPGTYGNCTIHPPGVKLTDLATESDQILVGRNRTRRGVNRRVRDLLGRKQLLPEAGDRLVCLRNDHDVGLLNGQIWITAQDVVDNPGDTYHLLAYNEDREEDILELTVWKDDPEWYNRREAQEFDYGYALTCHKAQGSQWDHVVVMDESSAFRGSKFQWLYTAITRAADRLDIIQI